MDGIILAQAAPNVDGLDALPEISVFSPFLWRTLAILLGLLLVSIILLRVILPLWMRRAGHHRSHLIEVVETHRLDARKSIYLVRVAGQYYLVGSSEGRLTTLAGQPLDPDAIGGALREATNRPGTPRAQSTPDGSTRAQPRIDGRINAPER